MGSFQTPISVQSSMLHKNSCGYLLQELQTIWDEIGEDQMEREKVLQNIEQECLEVYRKKVDYANMARSKLHQELADSESEFTNLLLSMGEQSLAERPQKKAGALRQQLNSITPALREMKLRKQQRMNQFHAIQEKIQKIKAEIEGLSEDDDFATTIIVNENDLSSKKLDEYKAELHKLQSEKSNRLQKVERYKSKIYALTALMGMDSSTTITKIHPSLNELNGIAKCISDYVLANLDDTVKSLEEEKQTRLEKLQHLGKAMRDMWNLLEIPEEERQQFHHITNLMLVPSDVVTKPGSLTSIIIQQAETEVTRLNQLKAAKMKELILRTEFELQEICSKSHMEIPSSSEMEKLTSQVDTGAINLVTLLKTMEQEIARAKEEATSRKAIMEKVDKWMLARHEERWLEEYNKDENRYSVSRGAHKNLKRAERARTMVTKMADLVGILISMIKDWEAEKNKEFIYDGVPLLAMLEEYTALRQEKEEEKHRQRMLKKKISAEQRNPLLNTRPGTSAQHIRNRNTRDSFNTSPTRSVNGSLSNRRLSLGAQQTRANSFDLWIPGSPFKKERAQTPRHQKYTQSELASRQKGEAASKVSTFSGPLSPES